MNNNDNILEKILLELKELRVEVVSLKKENKLLKTHIPPDRRKCSYERIH